MIVSLSNIRYCIKTQLYAWITRVRFLNAPLVVHLPPGLCSETLLELVINKVTIQLQHRPPDSVIASWNLRLMTHVFIIFIRRLKSFLSLVVCLSSVIHFFDRWKKVTVIFSAAYIRLIRSIFHTSFFFSLNFENYEKKIVFVMFCNNLLFFWNDKKRDIS